MQRENRYLVIKKRDITAAIDAGLISFRHADDLNVIADVIDDNRERQGKSRLQCVVVESDWPEYEPTWKAIEARVDGKNDEPDDLQELLTFYSVSTVKDLVAEMKKHVEQLVARVHEEPFKFQRAPREG